jgi:hypothetical protein
MSVTVEAGTLVALAAQGAVQAKDAILVAQRNKENADVAAIEVFVANDVKTHVLPNGDRVTVVVPEGNKVKRDEKALAKLISADVWEQITVATRKVDESLLNEAVLKGLIDPTVVQSVSTTVAAGSPYVKVTFNAVDTEDVA